MFVIFQIFASTVEPAPRRSPLTQIKYSQIQGSCTVIFLNLHQELVLLVFGEKRSVFCGGQTPSWLISECPGV